jgi:hypothetical protein
MCQLFFTCLAWRNTFLLFLGVWCDLFIYLFFLLFGCKIKFSYKPTTWQFLKSFTYTFSYMIYLMSHVTCLKNTCGWSYELSRS